MIKVLSIGAGPEQISSIILARKLGLHVIAIDKSDNAVGFQFANETCTIDIANENEVIEFSKAKKINAVIPAPIGRFLSTVGAVNDALNLIGISKKAACYCTDKHLFQQLMSQVNLARPFQIIVTDKSQLLTVLSEVQFPVVLKPRNGSGSKGVVVIKSKDSLCEAINEHNFYNDNDHTLIEEFIEGPEFGVDGVVVNGVFSVVLIRGKELTPLPHRQATGLYSADNLDSDTKLKITQVMSQCVNALSLDNCLINADIIVEPGGRIIVIEIAGRPGGLNISNIMIPYALGVNYLEQGIKLSLGLKTDFSPKHNKPFVFRFIKNQGSKFSAEALIEENPAVVDVVFAKVAENDQKKITCGADVLAGGYLMTTGCTIQDAFNTNNKILEYINVGVS